MNKWDKKFFGLARYWSRNSKDPSTKVGAVIVGRHKTQVALGYNGFPPGVEDREDRLEDRKIKYELIQHAERNVLDNVTFDTEGATLYATQFPCPECAKSIITKRLVRVVAPSWYSAPERWKDKGELANAMFVEAGIEVTFTDREENP